jgi:hypothetical protein
VVYAKPPFATPDTGSNAEAEDVLKYVARYTHRVAISNDRLLDLDHHKIQFRWKDYRDGNQHKTMTLTAEEFIRRFLIHVLPQGFQRIRYYGFLGNSCRKQKLARCRELLKVPPSPDPDRAVNNDYRDHYEHLTGASLKTCPVCQHGQMVVIDVLEAVVNCPPTIDTS